MILYVGIYLQGCGLIQRFSREWPLFLQRFLISVIFIKIDTIFFSIEFSQTVISITVSPNHSRLCTLAQESQLRNFQYNVASIKIKDGRYAWENTFLVRSWKLLTQFFCFELLKKAVHIFGLQFVCQIIMSFLPVIWRPAWQGSLCLLVLTPAGASGGESSSPPPPSPRLSSQASWPKTQQTKTSTTVINVRRGSYAYSRTGAGRKWSGVENQPTYSDSLTLKAPVPIISEFFIFYWHIAYQLLNIVKIKRAINRQKMENGWPPFCQVWIIFTHLKLWIASARHNFRLVKIPIEYFGVLKGQYVHHTCP